MKAVFISYNQALQDRVMETLDKQFIRGFSRWDLTYGRGTHMGEPHYGSHAWPSMNTSILTIIEEDKVERLLEALHEIDTQAEQHGLRAFVWDITNMI